MMIEYTNEITPRDLFAASALMALVTISGHHGSVTETIDLITERSFDLADAMMQKRAKVKPAPILSSFCSTYTNEDH